MIIFRNGAYFPNGDGEVVDEKGIVLSKFTVCVRVKIIDSESELYGWNWVFVVFDCGVSEVYVNGEKYYDGGILTINDDVEEDKYFLENSYISQVVVWNKILSEDEMKVVENSGCVGIDNVVLWVMFNDEVKDLAGRSILVSGGEYVIGDSVDGVVACFVAKVI